MLDTFTLYNDLCVEIEIIKEQLNLTERELEYWFGVKMHDWNRDGIPLGAKGVAKFGVLPALEQAEIKITSINKLRGRLEELEASKEKMETLMRSYEGVPKKIAYMRFVEGKSLKTIAEELKYSYDYVRELMSKMKKVM
ncbi:hypothetical protein BhaS171_00066 [Bacillus phage vB_BhaS-171]|uniref:hypothetical protein n=1 Tax=Bacillus phage vB_BhaS-171 TaxID=1775140 RepID=UPI000744D488|nr:hypothetical protein BH781_gp66 [Bacillus phage vB_BhaS-171]ALY08122.1 hypothetical protein BhaS171_00066 [Bacillus phage vB_BhaS-171]